VLVQACLNGGRTRRDHRRCPLTPAELAAEAAAVVAAGADAVHVHPRDDGGDETLEGRHVDAAVGAVRSRVPVPVGVTTGAWIEPDPADRLARIRAWRVLPDMASVNFHEPGAVDVAVLLLERGVAVEAGVWSEEAARVLLDSGVAPRCLRFLLEPMDADLDATLGRVGAIEAVLDDLPAPVTRLLHGAEGTAWDVFAEAARRGYDGRMGLEDTLQLPDRTAAAGNADLVAAACERRGER